MFEKSEDKDGYRPGITLRSIAAMVFCILATSAYTNFSCTYLAERRSRTDGRMVGCSVDPMNDDPMKARC